MLAGGEPSLEDAYQKMLAPADSSLNMLKFSRTSSNSIRKSGIFLRNDDDDTNRSPLYC